MISIVLQKQKPTLKRCQGIYQRSQIQDPNRWNSYVILSDSQARFLTSRLCCLKAIFLLLQPLAWLRLSLASFCVISILLSVLFFGEHLSCPPVTQ